MIIVEYDKGKENSMKVKVQPLPEGVIVLQISEALDRNEVATLIQGVEKLLKTAKSKLIVALEAKAIADVTGVKLLEKDLRNHQQLARKMGGDILYVVPRSFLGKIPNSLSDLKAAIGQLSKQPDPKAIGQEKTLKGSAETDPQERIKILELENEALTAKVRELLQIVGKPSTDEQLRAAVEFYRKLAIDGEQVPPGGPPSA
jgi:hypothetical protein